MSSVFDDEIVQMRITDLEYKFPEMTDAKIIEAIERIYLEEMGRPINKNIHIERMDGYSESSDAKGTAIVLTDTEDLNDVKEVVFISRGSVSTEDWIDNLLSIGVGTGGAGYARDTKNYLDQVTEQYKLEDDTPIYALAHSKGHNTVAAIQLSDDYFSQLNTFNGAQANAVQQIRYDEDFRRAVEREFNLTRLNTEAVQSIPPKELEAFAKEYYKDKEAGINQTRSKSDFLYALDSFPWMFVVGDVTTYRTDHENKGFVGPMEVIPQEDLQALLEFLAPYGHVYAEKGITGVMDEAFNDALAFYKDNPSSDPLDFDTMKSTVSVLVDELGEAGYLSEEDASQLRWELRLVLTDIEAIYKRVHEGEGTPFMRLLEDALFTGVLFKFSTEQRLASINTLFEGVAQAAEEHHKLEALMNEIAEGKSYHGGDLYLEGSAGGDEIKLNLSKTLDAYETVQRILDEQDKRLERYLAMVEHEYIDFYEQKKKQLASKMSLIESNYRSYQHLLPISYSGLITNLQFRESFLPLVGAPLEGVAFLVKLNRESTEEKAKAMRESVEEMFDVDHNVADMFAYLSG
ncbi:hypothetical protein JOC54_000011 [Alkalihalobacillus xiaoxiensis]|uniref:DUF6792 domain-containing protein n=1 Tax=Shouchella xiaoxiensis TaxID=766895 RepID=A0ABS2SNH6_9BACI|nr:DUF6792 domain-containing protein [Shouchella xiaoxiensis]MBM7836780.1 hypothetical protein [Shouchella xiaoxiensis]